MTSEESFLALFKESFPKFRSEVKSCYCGLLGCNSDFKKFRSKIENLLTTVSWRNEKDL